MAEAVQTEAEFVIKNGSGSKPDVRIKARLSSTVAELKALLQRDYPDNPAPSQQTVSLVPLCNVTTTLPERMTAHTCWTVR